MAGNAAACCLSLKLPFFVEMRTEFAGEHVNKTKARIVPGIFIFLTRIPQSDDQKFHRAGGDSCPFGKQITHNSSFVKTGQADRKIRPVLKADKQGGIFHYPALQIEKARKQAA